MSREGGREVEGEGEGGGEEGGGRERGREVHSRVPIIRWALKRILSV